MRGEKTTPLVLLRDYAEALRQLRRSGILRSTNNPVADYTEYLVAAALKLTLVNNSNAGFDATDEAGRKYEIKGRRLTPQNNSRQLSALRDLDARKFDFLAGVLFDDDFVVRRACLVPHEVVMQAAAFRKHVRAHILHLRDGLWENTAVQDITERVAAAQRHLETA